MGLKESMSYPATRNRIDKPVTTTSTEPSGDEGTTSAAPVAAPDVGDSTNTTTATPTGTVVTIETFQEKHFADLVRLEKDFLNSKLMCCCIPLGSFATEAEVRKTFKKHPEMMEVGAMAFVEGQAVGFIQVVLHGMPCDIHTVEKDEAYVYMIAVDPDARGMGVGSKLLAWADEIGRQHGCEKITLDVLEGNKAIGLYQRKGYTAQPTPLYLVPMSFIFTALFVGCRIRPRGSPAYWSFGPSIHMVKKL